jgi:putative hydrolase of the HAD superfamily
MIAAVCFDLFETLMTEYRADYQPKPSIAEILQIEPTEFGRSWATLMPAKFRGELPDFPSVLREICRRAGKQAPETLIDQLHEERLLEKTLPFAQIDSRILAMLTALRQRGLKLALVSNASSEEVTAWSSSDLAPFFDAAIFSHIVGRMKPEAEIYWLACQTLEVEPSATLFIGDGGSDELTGAQQAGLTPYWATWFLDQWPFAKQSAQQKEQNKQFVRLAEPSDLLVEVEKIQGDSSLHSE